MDAPANTFHLTPVEVWLRQAREPRYIPEPFEREGFIHCTDGEERVIDVGNRYYTGDSREFCLLTIARAKVAALIVYEDEERVFPHIYGPLETSAVVSVRLVVRGSGGIFLAIGNALPTA